jgi:flagellar FliJ protein
MGTEFSLERVLSYRRQKEQELAVQLARMEESYRQELDKLRKLQLEQVTLNERWKSSLANGPLHPQRFIAQDIYARTLEDKIRYQALQVSGLARDIENKRAQLLEAMKERKKIERLKEEWHRQVLKDQLRAENNTIDEVGTNMHNRKASA